MPNQRGAWRFDRVGWFGLLVLIALTLAELFSKGPLSQVEPQSSDGSLKVRYERFSRNGASDDVIVTAKGNPNRMLYLVLNGELFEGLSIEGLNPQPAPLRSKGRDLVIPTLADEDGTATLYLTVSSNGVGLLKGRARLLNGPVVAIPKFIYP